MTDTSGVAPTTRSSGLRMPFGRRGHLIAVLMVIAAGMAVNWNWLTAIGAAPVILSLAPCAVMCAAGLCMRGGSTSCANKNDPTSKPDA